MLEKLVGSGTGNKEFEVSFLLYNGLLHCLVSLSSMLVFYIEDSVDRCSVTIEMVLPTSYIR